MNLVIFIYDLKEVKQEACYWTYPAAQVDVLLVSLRKIAQVL